MFGVHAKISGRRRGRLPGAVGGLARAAILLTLPAAVAQGQDDQERRRDREATAVIRGAESTEAVAARIIARALPTLERVPAWQPGDPIKEVPRRTYGREIDVPAPEPKSDPLLGFQARAAIAPAAPAGPALEPPTININGQGFSGVNPPDVVGDVSPDHYIQAINSQNGTSYTVHQKSDGGVVAGPFLLSALGGTGVTGAGDPIVMYDHLAKRWVLSEFAPSPANILHVYVSRTPDPLSGGWFHYPFTTPNFPDYPKYAVWPDAYYVTSNESSGPAIYALDREKMLAGKPATMQRFSATMLNGFGFQALTPGDLDGQAPPDGSPAYMLRHHDDEVHNEDASDPSQDFLDLYEVRPDWGTPAMSSLTGPIAIPLAEFDSHLCGLTSFSCFSQQGSSTRLDPLREVIMWRLQYRNFGAHETMVGSFVTDVDGHDHGGVRWFELRKVPGSVWRVHQEGTYAPDSHNRWMSSIAMDGSGNIALAFNCASTTRFPGLRYVGRLASDPMGTMPQGEFPLVDGAAANASFRYGDYASLTVDPDDDRVFWFTGQHNAASTWATRIAAFRFK